MQSAKDFEEQQRQQMEIDKKAKERLDTLVNGYMQEHMEKIKQALAKEGVLPHEMKKGLQFYRKQLQTEIIKNLPELIKKVKSETSQAKA